MVTKEQLIKLMAKCKPNQEIVLTKVEEEYNDNTDEYEDFTSYYALIKLTANHFHIKNRWGHEYSNKMRALEFYNSAKLGPKGKMDKMRMIMDDKSPTTDDNYVGVEIEFISELSEDALQDKLADADLQDYVTLKEDGSLDTSGSFSYAHEICVLAKQSEITKVINKLCKLLAKNSDVNKSCGLHVHLDMRNRNATQAYENLWKAQGLLYAMSPKSRRDNTYCNVLKNYVPFVNGVPSCNDRYVGINTKAYNEHKTIEIRIHSGTIMAFKINNWIRLLLKIADAPKSSELSGFEADYNKYKKAFNIGGKLNSYVKDRLLTFKQQHGTKNYISMGV